MASETHEIRLPKQIWKMIADCQKSGLYGDTKDEVILTLMRSGGFDGAILIGATKTYTK